MPNSNKFENFFSKITEMLPEGAKTLSDDLKLNWQESMQQVVSRMDLVPRKEFDIQAKVLARTREKLEALEKQVKLLETVIPAKAGI